MGGHAPDLIALDIVWREGPGSLWTAGIGWPVLWMAEARVSVRRARGGLTHDGGENGRGVGETGQDRVRARFSQFSSV